MAIVKEDDFYRAVGAMDFPRRYYGLCARFPFRNIAPCEYKKADVMRMLAAMGRTARWDRRDNSYSIESKIGRATIHLGFVIQESSTVEFWLWLEQAQDRIGSNYAVIAHEATKAMGVAAPNPPYPRPAFTTLHELKDILLELFLLADTMLDLLKSSP